MIRRVLLWLAVFALVATPAMGYVVSVQPSKDNTIYAESGTTSNGAGKRFFAGVNNRQASGQIRRGLIAFDLSVIPTDATITNVSLTLYMSRHKSGTAAVTLQRLLAGWGEGTSVATGEEGKGATATTNDATWSHRLYPGTTWAVPGGDFSGTISATTPVGVEGFYTWSSTQMIADVQAWVTTPSSNFGWMVRGDESQKTTARRFEGRTADNTSWRPHLDITYVLSTVTGACCLPNDSCAVLTPVDCAAAGGSYQGDGTICTPDPCAPPTGACCLDAGVCDTLTETECLAAGGTYLGDGAACAPTSCPVLLTPFVDALPRPAVAIPDVGTPGNVASYTIPITERTQTLHRDLPPTRVWTYGGSYPGPTIEAYRDREVTVTWTNDLRDSLGVLRTTHFLPVDPCLHGPDMEGSTPRAVVHLHGGHVPPASDGYPTATMLPGEQDTDVYPNDQNAATLWYHDHAMGITRLNVIMGLAGFYVLRDSVEQTLALPSGENEIAMAIQDRTFNANGSISYPAAWEEDYFGDKILVNGKVWPYLNVNRGKYRFRLLNGANSRVFTLALSDGTPFWVIGDDQGLLPAPVRRDSLTLTPGERADVVLDFAQKSPGAEIILRNSAPAPFPGTPGEGVIPDVMKFVVGGSPGYTSPLPATLRPVPRLNEADAAQSRSFTLSKIADPCTGSKWAINGLGFDDITEYPVLGTTEVWSFINRSGMVHPMHMHLVQFQVLDRQPFITVNDSIVPTGSRVPPDSSEAGWKDTAPVYPNEIMRVITRFEDYAGRYPYHCHILEHEDQEMMRQFEVVLPTDVRALARSAHVFPSHPNPFRDRMWIDFVLTVPGDVRLVVEDVAGRLVTQVAEGRLPAGQHQVSWDGRTARGERAAPGVYFYRLIVGNRNDAARRLVILR